MHFVLAVTRKVFALFPIWTILRERKCHKGWNQTSWQERSSWWWCCHGWVGQVLREVMTRLKWFFSQILLNHWTTFGANCLRFIIFSGFRKITPCFDFPPNVPVLYHLALDSLRCENVFKWDFPDHSNVFPPKVREVARRSRWPHISNFIVKLRIMPVVFSFSIIW